MIRVSIDPSEAKTSEALMIEAARSWRRARDAGIAVMPSLHAVVSPLGWPMLAPAVDSMMRLLEERLRRQFEVGGPAEASADERLLARLMESARGVATPLACALCSTRIILDPAR